MTLREWSDLLELVSYVTIILGLPAALYQYRRKTVKEQMDREYGTYNALDEKYLDFQRLCFEYPQLDIFDIPDTRRQELTSEEKKRELIAFTMLFSIFERAYLMYADQSSTIKRRQWTGWLEYLTEYCARANFRRAWRISGNTFDTTFQEFVEATISRVARADHGGHIATRLAVLDPETTSRAVDLMANHAVAGSLLTSNQLAYVLTNGPELGFSNELYLAEGEGTAGALLATKLSGGMLLIPGIGIRGPCVVDTMLSLLDALRGSHDALASGVLVVESCRPAPPAFEQSIPGMGCFREVVFPYQYIDGTPALLWVWTTSETVAREEVSSVLRQIISEFYAPLRVPTIAHVMTSTEIDGHVDHVLRDAPERIPVRNPQTLRPVARER